MLKLTSLLLSLLIALPSFAGKTQQKIDAIRAKAEADIKAAEQGKPGDKKSISGDYNSSSASGGSAGGDMSAVARKKDRKKKAKKSAGLLKRQKQSELRNPASYTPGTESMPQTTGVR